MIPLLQRATLLASLLLAACGPIGSEDCKAPVGGYELDLTIRSCANGGTAAPRKETVTFGVDGKLVASDCVTQQQSCDMTVNCNNGAKIYSLTLASDGRSLTGTKTVQLDRDCGGMDGGAATWTFTGTKL